MDLNEQARMFEYGRALLYMSNEIDLDILLRVEVVFLKWKASQNLF